MKRDVVATLKNFARLLFGGFKFLSLPIKKTGSYNMQESIQNVISTDAKKRTIQT